jgi:hypothetical protein
MDPSSSNPSQNNDKAGKGGVFYIPFLSHLRIGERGIGVSVYRWVGPSVA